MENFDSLAPLTLPDRLEILREVLSLPEVARQATAEEMADLFGALRAGSAAYRAGAELAFLLGRELGATHVELAASIGKGLKGSSRSRERTLSHRYPGGSGQLVDRIRAQYERLGGALPVPSAEPIPMPADETADR